MPTIPTSRLPAHRKAPPSLTPSTPFRAVRRSSYLTSVRDRMQCRPRSRKPPCHPRPLRATLTANLKHSAAQMSCRRSTNNILTSPSSTRTLPPTCRFQHPRRHLPRPRASPAYAICSSGTHSINNIHSKETPRANMPDLLPRSNSRSSPRRALLRKRRRSQSKPTVRRSHALYRTTTDAERPILFIVSSITGISG